MKRYFIILSLLSLTSFAYQVTTYEPINPWVYYSYYKNPYYNGFRPTYNPYNPYNNPYNNPYYRNNAIRNYYTKPSQRIRPMKKTPKKFKRISFLNFNNNGSITGYSVPINKNNAYSQMGISPYDPKSKQKYNSINCNQELFSTPSGDEMYYKNGEYYKDLRGVSGKTGVTIIYD